MVWPSAFVGFDVFQFHVCHFIGNLKGARGCIISCGSGTGMFSRISFVEMLAK
jgi:hypothetical protein